MWMRSGAARGGCRCDVHWPGVYSRCALCLLAQRSSCLKPTGGWRQLPWATPNRF
jgi:hypothetical protein